MSPTGQREESGVDPHQRRVDTIAGALYEMVHADLETAPAFDELKADRRCCFARNSVADFSVCF